MSLAHSTFLHFIINATMVIIMTSWLDPWLEKRRRFVSLSKNCMKLDLYRVKCLFLIYINDANNIFIQYVMTRGGDFDSFNLTKEVLCEN